MVTRWTVGALDKNCLFEVINSQDVDTANRFSLPIPNLLGPNGEPIMAHKNIAPKLDDAGQIVINPKTGKPDYRFTFHNHKDNKKQEAKIDGTGCILFMSPSDRKSAAIKQIVKTHGLYSGTKDPAVLQTIIEEIYFATAIGDRWHASLSEIDKKYEPVEGDVEDKYFGRFVYKPFISSAVYLGGQGIFDGDAGKGQSFHKGAFIIFPEKSLDEAKKIIDNFDPLDVKGSSGGGKLIDYAVFLATRTLPDGKPIEPSSQTRQDKPKLRYHKVTSIPGFPDSSDTMLALEKDWLEKVERVYALYGFSPIKTRTVEELSVLRLEEGESGDKSQIFEVTSLFENATKGPRLGLRYDHTVSLARYIAENKGTGGITFPFKSQRIGNVYRSQDVLRGKHREFMQADIDVVGVGYIPPEYDVEIPNIMSDLANELQLGILEISISNRKITKGFFESIGLDATLSQKIIRLIELRDTLGIDGIRAKMYEGLNLDKDITELCLSFAKIKTADNSFEETLNKLCTPNPLMKQGIEELKAVILGLNGQPNKNIYANMSVVRGMEYYTGTVYEARSSINPKYPPIMVGGRYDNMVGHFMKDEHPAVGFSFEFTAAMNLFLDHSSSPIISKLRSQILVAFQTAAALPYAEQYARDLRLRGLNVEIAYERDHPSQMSYADKKGIPYVLDVESEGGHMMRDMRLPRDDPHKVQIIDLSTWSPK